MFIFLSGPCFDLIVKNENLGDEKLIYKFWIQNLSNEIYDKIIDGSNFFFLKALIYVNIFFYFFYIVYYKTMNLFIFVYNVCDRGSYRKVEEQYDHIKEISKNGSLNCLLIGMHFSPKFKIVIHFYIISNK